MASHGEGYAPCTDCYEMRTSKPLIGAATDAPDCELCRLMTANRVRSGFQAVASHFNMANPVPHAVCTVMASCRLGHPMLRNEARRTQDGYTPGQESRLAHQEDDAEQSNIIMAVEFSEEFGVWLIQLAL